MKLLVTGGAGFIGCNFIEYMLKKYPKYEVVNVDLLTYAGCLENNESIKSFPHYHFIQGDICDRQFIFDLFEQEKFDWVINFAAESHVDRSIEDPSVFLKTNILGTQVLMDACRTYHVKRFHQVSTDEVYGDLPLADPSLFTEKFPLKASSPYSASKASADLLTLAYYRTFKLPVTISRCSNNYGPFQFPEKLIPLMILKAMNNEQLPVYGTGENIRDWLHVWDHCQAIDFILHKGTVGEIYNIGGNNEYSNLKIVKMILDELNKSYDLIEFVDDRPGHDLRYAVDSSKIKEELDWEPHYTFEEGLKSTISWYVDKLIENKKRTL
ncbi:MAG: dTDP-glucose 4,6-dehydratase [Turicibacter sp.]|nr:dTDP-glucose 4,6-dehydratase [Turicibacter sp.]